MCYVKLAFPKSNCGKRQKVLKFTINPSKEINKFGDFKFDLGKRLDV